MRVVHSEQGIPLKSEFSVGGGDGRYSIWLESRSGGIGTARERNPDYSTALRLILQRLAALGAVLVDAEVDSKTSVNLPREEKVVSAGFPLPLALEGTDPEEIRLAMQLSQRSVGHRFENPGSGSDGRRLRLDVRIAAVASAVALEIDLARGLVEDDRPSAPRLRAVGQGYAGDAKSRKAIEDRAMALTLEHLQGKNWAVEDVHLNESYDYLATKNGEEMHVEVKGLVGSLQEVFITINERRHAERWPKTALAIVTDIKVDRSGEDVTADGGTLDFIDPWRIEDGDLEPTQFKWRRRQPG